MTQNPKPRKKAQPAKKTAAKKPAQKKTSTPKKPVAKKTPAKKAQPRKNAKPKEVVETVVAEFAHAGENATIVAEQTLDNVKTSIFARIKAWLRAQQ